MVERIECSYKGARPGLLAMLYTQNGTYLKGSAPNSHDEAVLSKNTLINQEEADKATNAVTIAFCRQYTTLAHG